MKNITLIFILSFFIKTSFSLLCKDSTFDRIFINMPLSFKVLPIREVCLKYKLTNSKNKIGLSFSLANSYTAEVVIYKSKYEIVMKNGEYINAKEKYSIAEHAFKEIDVSDFYDYVYIIIRDNKDYFFYDHIILYDSEVPIKLSENTPIEMANFMSNNNYTFTFSSNKNLQFVYSSKIKSQKLVTVEYNNNKNIEKIDSNDIIINLNNDDLSEKDLIVTIENKGENNENQEFSVIVYEKDEDEFINIDKDNTITKYYIKNEYTQNFYFYSDISNYIKSSSVIFKLDYMAKVNKYINIISDIIYSDESLNSEQLKNLIPEENKLNYSYDINSDEYLKLYFNDKIQTHKYKYIIIKLEIKDYSTYYSPNYFTVSLSEELKEINVENLPYYTAKTIILNTNSYIPFYYKLLLDPQSKYIFTAPYQDYIFLRKGDLIVDSKVNNDYLDDKKDIIVLNGLSELTVEIFGEQLNDAIFYIEKINASEVNIIENERDKNNELTITMNEDECNQNKKKYILGTYDKDTYEYGDQKITKYWTKLDGEMNLYYKNNLLIENQSLFPSLEIYKKTSDKSFLLDNHIDLFTITCTKPGTLFIRPLTKTFTEKTHIIGENSISSISINSNVEILQLTTPIKSPSNILYLSILPLNGKKIIITPDTSGLFNEVTIDKNNIFTKEIDINKYKSDQLAIKISSDEPVDLEVIEIIHYNFSEYLNINNNKKIETVKNNVVKFIDKNTKKLKISINGLNNVPTAFGIVKLPTNNINYIPLAYNFENDITKKKCANNEVIEIDNKYYGKDDAQKKYQAFVFSIQSSNTNFKYDIQIEEISEEKGTSNWIIVILIIVLIIVILLIIIIVIIVIKKKKGKNNIENLSSHSLEQNNKYILNEMMDENL